MQSSSSDSVVEMHKSKLSSALANKLNPKMNKITTSSKLDVAN